MHNPSHLDALSFSFVLRRPRPKGAKSGLTGGAGVRTRPERAAATGRNGGKIFLKKRL